MNLCFEPCLRLLRSAGLAVPALLAGTAAHAQYSEMDVPFITTPDRVTLALLQLAALGPGDRLIDLGSGDGRVVITAARRFGVEAAGVDIDPFLVDRSRQAARQAGVAQRVSFREQNLFDTDLTGYTVVTLYLLPAVNLALRPRLLALPPGTRVVSHDWDMGDWAPDWTLTLPVPEKTIGREKASRVMRWTVPAPVAGDWCGQGAAAGARLQLNQRYQQVQARLTVGDQVHAFDARLDGAALQSLPLQARWQAGHLAVEQAQGPLAGWVGGRFVPAQAGGC